MHKSIIYPSIHYLYIYTSTHLYIYTSIHLYNLYIYTVLPPDSVSKRERERCLWRRSLLIQIWFLRLRQESMDWHGHSLFRFMIEILLFKMWACCPDTCSDFVERTKEHVRGDPEYLRSQQSGSTNHRYHLFWHRLRSSNEVEGSARKLQIF